MASHRDFEKLWSQYQKDGAKRNVTIAQYCKRNGIVYAHFDRWYRSYFHKKSYEVEIVNAPEIGTSATWQTPPQKAPQTPPQVPAETPTPSEPQKLIDATQAELSAAPMIAKVDLRLSNGLEYHAEQISSKALASLISKLEAICLG